MTKELADQYQAAAEAVGEHIKAPKAAEVEKESEQGGAGKQGDGRRDT